MQKQSISVTKRCSYRRIEEDSCDSCFDPQTVSLNRGKLSMPYLDLFLREDTVRVYGKNWKPRNVCCLARTCLSQYTVILTNMFCVSQQFRIFLKLF
jgi:hypothetical protein